MTRQYSKIVKIHYIKLLYRSAIFFAAIASYIIPGSGEGLEGHFSRKLLLLVWVVFMAEMLSRFFPSKLESMGCQKQFAKNFIPTRLPLPRLSLTPAKRVAGTIAAWCLLNGAIALLYFEDIIDEGVMLLVSLFYSVCDMICILFFCPFQRWFLGNRCCTTCRIYNWDFAMMFTPMLFIGGGFALSLALVSLALLVRWELTYKLHPERFSPSANKSLECANCREKLCLHNPHLLKKRS